jgi:hypothetical protein
MLILKLINGEKPINCVEHYELQGFAVLCITNLPAGLKRNIYSISFENSRNFLI